jgi:alpha-L-glutamate ligase-like protein
VTLRGRLRALAARRRDLYGINRRNVELVYAHNPRRHYPVADDKLLAKERLSAAGVPVPDTLVVCDGLFAIPRVLDRLAEASDFVIKPASGGGGRGIVVVGARLGPGRWRRAGGSELSEPQLQRHLAEIVLGAHSDMLADRALIEPRIDPHPIFRELWADGLCDVRVITLHARPVMAMVRVPTAQSGGRANLHQGGLGLAIDLASGRTFRALHRGASVTHHPESGSALIGIALPSWAQILDVSRRAAEAVPLGYLGCDVVVDRERGPLILEINARPGLEIQNVNGLGLGPALAAAAAAGASR